MIKDLKEAIAHAREVAETQRGYTKAFGDRPVTGAAKNYVNLCLECAAEHEQLAGWLTELQERRAADKWIPVCERLPNDRDWCLGVFREPDTGFIGLPYICDYVGEVTKGTTNEGWILRHCTDVDNASVYFRNLICVAWRPLPEPYKKGGVE